MDATVDQDAASRPRTRRWRAEFLVLAGLLVATRVADGVLTHAITPDLSREVNPVHSVAGLGWAGLIGVAAVVLAGVLWLNHVSLTRPCDVFPATAGASWPVFRASYFRADAGGAYAREPGRVMRYVCGYVFPRAIIVWSLVLLLHNALVLADAAWYRPLRASGATYGIYPLLPVLSYLFVARLQRRDYLRYRSRGA